MNVDKNKSDRSSLFSLQIPALVVILLLTFCENNVHAQTDQDDNSEKERALNKYTNEYEAALLPLFFEKEPPVGTAYFTEYWMKGAAEFINHQTIPTREKPYYFNFDKLKNVLIVTDDSLNVSYYHGDVVRQFILLDSLNQTYKFEIVPTISRSFYLQPILAASSGYSLYKRLITKLAFADYQSYGYGHTGVKHDTYNDSYEYYFVYPDKTTFKKFYLDGSPAVKKVFKAWPVELETIMNKYAGSLNEDALTELVEMINKTH